MSRKPTVLQTKLGVPSALQLKLKVDPRLAGIVKQVSVFISHLGTGTRRMQVLGTITRRQKPVALPSMRAENQVGLSSK